MTTDDLVRAWKDPDYRTDGYIDHPSGEIELHHVGGMAVASEGSATLGCCSGAPWCFGTQYVSTLGCCTPILE